MSIQKRWRINCAPKDKTDALFRDLKIHPVLCNILVQRGIETYEMAKNFFRPQLENLHDPFLMKDMEKATARILQAFSAHEKILVFGDYDVDGATPAALLLRFFAAVGGDASVYVPDRLREGYGPNAPA